MLKKIRRKFKSQNISDDVGYESNIYSKSQAKEIYLDKTLNKNVNNIRKIFGESSDLKIREIEIGLDIKIAIIFLEGLVKESDINELLIKFLTSREENIKSTEINKIFKQGKLPSTSINEIQSYEELCKYLLDGFVIVLINQFDKGYVLNYIGGEERNIEDSQLEKSLRGPRDAFIEDIKTNMSLIRKKIKNINLQSQIISVGTRTNTEVNIVYMKDIANPKIVDEVKKRIMNIDYDNIQDGTYLAHLISDNPVTIFPLIVETEKPDKVASNLLEGRVAVLSDNNPSALLVPSVFIDYFHVPDDFHERYYSALVSRVVRYLGGLLAVFATPVYIALTSVNVDMLPTKLAIPFSQVRYIVPFSLIIEALIMEVTLELLREAGLRIPNPIGPAISIVGGLVVGQTAVTAGLISPFLTIVVAISAIGSFANPSVDLVATMRITKFFFIIGAGIFGLFGLGAFTTILVIHCCSLRSFGVPYFAPFSEEGVISSLTSIFRLPFILDTKRHIYYRASNNKKVRN